VSVNEGGLAVEVHETQALTSKDLWSHVWRGHIMNLLERRLRGVRAPDGRRPVPQPRADVQFLRLRIAAERDPTAST
jgi:hypothetical protein